MQVCCMRLRYIPDEAHISQARALLCSVIHLFIYKVGLPQALCLMLSDGVWAGRDDTHCNLSLWARVHFSDSPHVQQSRGGRSLTFVSASVALSSNSVMVFLTPSWTLIPRLCTTGKESSTGFMVMSNVWLTWNRRKSLSWWIQFNKSTTPFKQ